MRKANTGNHYLVILLLSVLAATIWSAFFPLFGIPAYLLNENQLLYLFSAMAQVIGGLFGLTLTAYVFFIDKIKDAARDDDTLYDATAALLSQCFCRLILIASICGATIFFCLLGMIALHDWSVDFCFLINESTLLFLIGTAAILVFGIQLLDPGKLDKELNQIKKDTEGYYSSTVSTDQANQVNFAMFLQTYNSLEKLIKDFAETCMGMNLQVDTAPISPYHKPPYKPRILQALDILSANEVINGSLLDEINRLRKYRNSAVHSSEKIVVSKSACDRIRLIFNVLNEAYEVYKKPNRTIEEWGTVMQKVYGLTKDF